VVGSPPPPLYPRCPFDRRLGRSTAGLGAVAKIKYPYLYKKINLLGEGEKKLSLFTVEAVS